MMHLDRSSTLSPTLEPRYPRDLDLVTSDLRLPVEGFGFIPDTESFRRKLRNNQENERSTWQVSSPGVSREKESIVEALRTYISIGQWFGLLPVQKILHNDHTLIRWLSLLTCYSSAVITLFVLLWLHLVYVIICDPSLAVFEPIAYIGGPLCFSIFSLRQATLLPALVKDWTKLEAQMNNIGSSLRLKKDLDELTYMNVIFVIGALICYYYPKYEETTHCDKDVLTRLHLMFSIGHHNLFHDFVDFTPWMIPILVLVQTFLRVTWMFGELTIIVFSYALYQRHKKLADHLELYRNKNMPASFWSQMRLVYNSLSRLTKMVDSFLSPTTCAVYLVNVYYICFTLLTVFTLPQVTTVTYYFLLYAILRIFTISLIASYINEQSKQPLSVLFEVPSESFCSEVVRFQMEVIADEITLTGCKFFSINRSFMLTVIGTIATYEVVLVQFRSRQPLELNSTSICSNISYMNAT